LNVVAEKKTLLFDHTKMEILGNYTTAKDNIGHMSLVPVTQKVHITLPAAYFGKLKQAISISLESKLSQYSSKFEGVPVAFDSKNVKLLSNLGSMIADQSVVHFDVQVDFIVFQPKIGEILEGVVNKLMDSTRPRFGCLVHGFFYVAVNCPAKEMPEVGDKVWFTVTSLENDGNGYLQIIGQFKRAEKQPVVTADEVATDYVTTDDVTTDKSNNDAVVKHANPSVDKESFPDADDTPEKTKTTDKAAVKEKGMKAVSSADTAVSDETESTPSKSKKSKHKKKEKKEKKSKKHKKSDKDADDELSSPSSKRTKIG